MTDTDEALRQVLSSLNTTPSGLDRIALLEPAIRHADSAGTAPDLRLRLCLDLLDEYGLQGRQDLKLATFTSCLSLAEEFPSEIEGELLHGLRWQEKQLVQNLFAFPEFSLEQLEFLDNDFERWLARTGHSQHSLLGAQAERANHLGDHERARTLLEQWRSTETDSTSDCPSCAAESQLALLHELGEANSALELGLSAVDAPSDCRNHPHGLLAGLQIPLAEQGRVADARRAHLRSYRAQRQRPRLSDRLNTHLIFCARTGNLDRGWEILDRHREMLADEQNPLQDLRHCSAASLLCSRLAEVDPDRTFALPADRFDADGPVPVAQVSLALATRARELAERFDARNGTKAVSKSVEEMLSLAPLPEVPLIERPAESAPVTEGPTSDSGGTVESLMHSLVSGAPEIHRDLPRSLPALSTKDETEPSATHRHTLLAFQKLWANDNLAAAGDLHEALQRYEAQGEHAFAAWVRVRLAGLLNDLGDGRVADQLQILAEQELDLTCPFLWDAPLRIHGLLIKGAPELATDFAERAKIQLAENPAVRELVLPVMHAQTAFGGADVNAAVRHLRASAHAPLDPELPIHPQLHLQAGSATMLAALLVDSAEDVPAALRELDDIIRTCHDHGFSIRPSLELARAKTLLLNHGQGGPDLEPFLAALQHCDEWGSFDERAQARQWLAKAYLHYGRQIETAELLESGLELSARSLDPSVRLETRFQLARACRELGEQRQAAELLEPISIEVLDNSTMIPTATGECVIQATSALWACEERDRAQELLDRGIAWQRHAGERLPLLALLQHSARTLNLAERVDDALASLDAAEEEMRQWHGEDTDGSDRQQRTGLRALLDLDRSRSLVLAGEGSRALTLLEDTERSVREQNLPQQTIVTRQRRTEVLLELERPPEAEQCVRSLLRELDASAIQEHGVDLARLLAQALDQQGVTWQEDEQLQPFLQS